VTPESAIPDPGTGPPHTWRREGYAISTDPARLDLDAIHGYLVRSYWAEGIPRETVARSLANSLNFGIYEVAGETGAWVQVGLARVVSDFSTFAYLGDVFVLETHRGRGLSTWVMACVMEHPALQGLRRWVLLTRDAHGIYGRFGFTPVAKPERYMEIRAANPYAPPDEKR